MMLKRLVFPILLAVGAFFAGIAFDQNLTKDSDKPGSRVGGHRVSAGEYDAFDEDGAQEFQHSTRTLSELRAGVDPADRRATRDRIHRALERANARDLARLVGELNRIESPAREDRFLMREV